MSPEIPADAEARIASLKHRLEEQIRRIKLIVDNACGKEVDLAFELLRGVVVLLYALIEETIREAVFYGKWDNSDFLRSVLVHPPGCDEPLSKVTLGDLVPYKDLTIKQLILNSVAEHVNRKSFTSMDRILSFLNGISLKPELPNVVIASLDAMISRRHQIVHNLDYLPTMKLDEFDEPTVGRWLVAVTILVGGIMAKLSTNTTASATPEMLAKQVAFLDALFNSADIDVETLKKILA